MQTNYISNNVCKKVNTKEEKLNFQKFSIYFKANIDINNVMYTIYNDREENGKKNKKSVNKRQFDLNILLLIFLLLQNIHLHIYVEWS